MSLEIRKIIESDIPSIMDSISILEWNREDTVYFNYLREQEQGLRDVFVAFYEGDFAGHVNLIWNPPYQSFSDKGIPEISDLIVLPKFRQKGIATGLMNLCETTAKNWSEYCGLGVGLYKDYGPAQCLYMKRGYQLDCLGATTHLIPVKPGTDVFVDDDLLIWLVKKL